MGKKIKDRKNKNKESSNEYLRSIKKNDRIKIFINERWKYGTVMNAWNETDNALIEFRHDENGYIQELNLNELEWDFEPENFTAPRMLKKLKRAQVNGSHDQE